MKAREVARQNEQVYVSPYNDPAVVAGQGTVGYEINNQCDGLDVINSFSRWWWTYWRYCVLPKICLA